MQIMAAGTRLLPCIHRELATTYGADILTLQQPARRSTRKKTEREVEQNKNDSHRTEERWRGSGPCIASFSGDLDPQVNTRNEVKIMNLPRLACLFCRSIGVARAKEATILRKS
jgi:hypothetical protein